MSELRTAFASALLSVVAIVGVSAQDRTPDAKLRLERVDVPGGAEVDTLIGTLPSGAEFPLISILVDTMGDSDPTNDTVRNVWVLTYARPTVIQRIVAGLPFAYLRAGSPHRREDSVPASILDMGAVGRNTWFKVFHAVAQSEFLDPIGMPVRASSRAYSGNTVDFRNEHVWQALNVLSAAHEEDFASSVSHDDVERIQARLLLSTQLFGDLVSDSYLTTAFEKERSDRLQYRQHNWELLRQKAEENGLYFQPVTLAFSNNANVLLWAPRPSGDAEEHSAFNGQFLGIGNPFEGNWLANWKGYTETWTLDDNGARVPEDAPGSHQAEMVPVALYSLDYPTAPLLLVDFKQPFKPKSHEMLRRATDQVITGVLGITTFGNLEYFAAKTSWTFIRRRHGAAVDRSARLRAYSQFRHALFLDGSMDRGLRTELLRRMDGLGLNPFEDSMATEAQLARDQYAALRAYATKPGGLERKLDRARSAEIAHQLHSQKARVMFRVASIGTLGMYRHRDQLTPELLADIDRRRRFAWNKRFLEEVIDSSPRPEVAYNMEQVQKSLDIVTRIGQESDDLRGASEELLRRVLAQTSDAETRRICNDCLQKLAMRRVQGPKVASAILPDRSSAPSSQP